MTTEAVRTAVEVVVPGTIDDPARPSGGNIYDRRVCAELTALGWSVTLQRATGSWPRPDATASRGLAATLVGVPDGRPVLVDGLVASAAPDVVAAAAARLRTVVLVHLPIGLDAPGQRTAEATMLRSVHAVVTTSAWTRTWLVEEYDVPPGRVTVARPGADPAALAIGTVWGGSLLCVGAVTRAKGHDLLLDALATIHDLPWRCTCVGSLDLDPAFAGELRTHAEQLGGRVVFTGPLHDADLDAAYRAADVLVLPSRMETYGMVVTEALAHGLPVIAARSGGIAEAFGWRTGHPAGLLVPPDDGAALAGALRSWLTDPELRDDARRAAGHRRTMLPSWRDTAAAVAAAVSG